MKTLSQHIIDLGIDEKKAISSFKRSWTRQQRQDRKKIYPASKGYMTDEQSSWRNIMQEATFTNTYVMAWCKANHLTI